MTTPTTQLNIHSWPLTAVVYEQTQMCNTTSPYIANRTFPSIKAVQVKLPTNVANSSPCDTTAAYASASPEDAARDTRAVVAHPKKQNSCMMNENMTVFGPKAASSTLLQCPTTAVSTCENLEIDVNSSK